LLIRSLDTQKFSEAYRWFLQAAKKRFPGAGRGATLGYLLNDLSRKKKSKRTPPCKIGSLKSHKVYEDCFAINAGNAKAAA
jgi:hypothetical protein